MEFSQLTAPMGWLLADILVGLTVLIIYRFVPIAYRLPLHNARWVLIPYVALLQGSVSPRLMGLTGINWLTSFGLGIGLIAAVSGLLVLVRSTTDFSSPTMLTPTVGERNKMGEPILQQSRKPMSLAPLFYAGAEEFHWSFLRGALWEGQQSLTTLPDQPAYWAIWIAALLAVPTILRFHTTLLARLFKIILLLLTTILFIYTQNFWLCWMLHSLVLLLLIP